MPSPVNPLAKCDNTSIEKETINLGLEFLTNTHDRMNKEQIKNYNGMFATIHKDGKVSEILNAPCHAHLANETTVDSYNKTQNFHLGSEIVATITHSRKFCNRSSYSQPVVIKIDPDYFNEVTHSWYDWLVNKSVFSPAILSDLETSKSLGLLINSHIPSNVLAAICIISRHTREHFGKVAGWKILVDKGVNPDLAFMISLGSGLFQNQLSVSAISERNMHKEIGNNLGMGVCGHNILTHKGSNLSNVENFIKHRTSTTLNKNYHENCNYFGVNALWSPLDYLAFSNSWETKLSNLIKDNFKGIEQEKSKIPNPFAPPVKDNTSTYVALEKFLDLLEPICEYLGAPLKSKGKVVKLAEPPIPDPVISIPAVRSNRKVA